MTGNRTARIVASVPVIDFLPCQTHIGEWMCSGSKYRFCVPQNRRACRRAAGHRSGEEVAR